MNQISMFFKTAFREDSDQFLQLWDLDKMLYVRGYQMPVPQAPGSNISVLK